jgi:hypothetical protein
MDAANEPNPLDALGLPEPIRNGIEIALLRIEVSGVGVCTPAPADDDEILDDGPYGLDD